MPVAKLCLEAVHSTNFSVEKHTPGNSHPNGTVKANVNINSKQTTLKATDNYVYTYPLCFMSLLYVFYFISAIMDDKKSLI